MSRAVQPVDLTESAESHDGYGRGQFVDIDDLPTNTGYIAY